MKLWPAALSTAPGAQYVPQLTLKPVSRRRDSPTFGHQLTTLLAKAVGLILIIHQILDRVRHRLRFRFDQQPVDAINDRLSDPALGNRDDR